MKIMVLGGDGYLGWPIALHFAAHGHAVMALDNYFKRKLVAKTKSEPLYPVAPFTKRAVVFEQSSGHRIECRTIDCTDYDALSPTVAAFKPDVIVHCAEQPSAPYSMIDRHGAAVTLQNNLMSTFYIVWAMLESAPDAHLIKFGTMGEYGTPAVDIEEGWLDLEIRGRRDRFLFPRRPGSLYHTTKVLDTDLLWFYSRIYGLRVTDLMQGPVYGMTTDEIERDERLSTAFHYDDIFGTVLNRFIVQAVAGVPLTVYGSGGQTRGFLNLRDTLQCVALAADNPPDRGGFRVYNQFTEQFSVEKLADAVREAAAELGLPVTVGAVENPRRELDRHYYNPKHDALAKLGLRPRLLTAEVLVDMLRMVERYRDRIDVSKIHPRVRW
jgi:UDP-sulfoquinovose synthase